MMTILQGMHLAKKWGVGGGALHEWCFATNGYQSPVHRIILGASPPLLPPPTPIGKN